MTAVAEKGVVERVREAVETARVAEVMAAAAMAAAS